MHSAAGQPAAAGIEGIVEPTAASTAFGKYQLFASLGRGGMADVFLAVARGPMGFNKLAVIKRLRQALADEPSFRNMFLDEARLAARLNHPNIVHTYEVGEHNGIYFIAMEYLEGQSLNKVMKEALKRREALPPALCARIVADALTGLHFAHTLTDYDGTPLHIIHRDVSPHNIFVTYEGHSKLVDFGIAKAALSSTETEVGVLKGKVAYMSPEQAMGGPIDARADVFPMGIVLWEMLTGQRLMTGESAAQTLHRLMNMPIPRASQARGGGIDPMLDDIVARALEKDPNMRFQSAAEMRDALEAWLARTGQSVRGEEVGRHMLHLFGKIREEVQRQIQKHMAAITQANNTQELSALNAEALRRVEGSGAHASGQLLRLGVGSGSGSGIVSNYPPAHSGSVAAAPVMPTQVQQSRTGGLALLLVAAGFFVLALAAFLLIYLRTREQPVALVVPTQSAQVIATAPGPGDPTTQPTGPATAPVSATGQPSTTAQTTATTAGPVDTSKPPIRTGVPVGPVVKPPPTQPSSKTTAATAATTPPPPPVAEESGFLSIDTAPWTRVTANGRVLGTTPLNKIALPPGTYTLSMENPEKGIKQTATVTIKSGEVTGKRFAF